MSHVQDEIQIVVCSTCQNDSEHQAGCSAIQEALSQANLDSHVRLVEHPCLNACGEPVSMGLQGGGRASYVFTGIRPKDDAADIVATCQSYLQSPKGWIEDARSCGRLRLCLRARLPAVPSPTV